MNEAIRMQLSAFVDGELPENEAELLLRRLSQDAELRQQVAEFMAIGRAMRGDVQVSGVDRLRERVAEAIDAAPLADTAPPEVAAGNRYLRPVAGFAIAATVAIVAIVGLRQISGVDGVEADAPAIAEIEAAPGYTQPQSVDILEDELLREMRRRHGEVASEQSIEARLTDVSIPPELIEDESDEEAPADESDEAGDSAPAGTPATSMDPASGE